MPLWGAHCWCMSNAPLHCPYLNRSTASNTSVKRGKAESLPWVWCTILLCSSTMNIDWMGTKDALRHLINKWKCLTNHEQYEVIRGTGSFVWDINLSTWNHIQMLLRWCHILTFSHDTIHPSVGMIFISILKCNSNNCFVYFTWPGQTEKPASVTLAGAILVNIHEYCGLCPVLAVMIRPRFLFDKCWSDKSRWRF